MDRDEKTLHEAAEVLDRLLTAVESGELTAESPEELQMLAYLAGAREALGQASPEES